MSEKTKARVVDILLLAMIIVPFVLAIALKVVNKPVEEGISITGAMVYLTIPMPLQDMYITESQVNSAAVIIALLGLCLVSDNMGKRFMGFAPFVAAILGLSAFSSLSSMLGLFPPTSDMNIVAGWAILVFILITHYKLKGGVWPYIKGFFEPIPVFMPFNVIGEFATPVSMSFRHYGNVLSGVVIATLVAHALQAVSKMLYAGVHLRHADDALYCYRRARRRLTTLCGAVPCPSID